MSVVTLAMLVNSPSVATLVTRFITTLDCSNKSLTNKVAAVVEALFKLNFIVTGFKISSFPSMSGITIVQVPDPS